MGLLLLELLVCVRVVDLTERALPLDLEEYDLLRVDVVLADLEVSSFLDLIEVGPKGTDADVLGDAVGPCIGVAGVESWMLDMDALRDSVIVSNFLVIASCNLCSISVREVCMTALCSGRG